MYIAIEGIKGSGKSTIINEIKSEIEQSDFTIYPITASMKTNHPLERVHQITPSLKNNDEFLEKLFIYRAYWHHPKHTHKMILGDRSILTSYVSRWTKWSDPYYTIQKVERQYKGIIKPNVLIWLETKTDYAVLNIKKRKQKDIRVSDETANRLLADKEVYEELIFDRLYMKKIKNTQIIIVPNNNNKEEVKKEISQIIKYYQQ
jgi:thymidylate kinase